MTNVVEQYRTETTINADNTYEHKFEGTAQGTTVTTTVNGSIDAVDPIVESSLQHARAHFASLAATAQAQVAEAQETAAAATE